MHNPLVPLFSLLVGGSGHLLLLVLFLCLGTPGIATNTDNTIQRINYGIIFEKSTNIFLGQENWLHTFQIQLPKNIHLDSLYCNMPKCKTVGHIIKSINLLRMQCMASVNTTVSQPNPSFNSLQHYLHNKHTLDHLDKREDFSISWVKFQNHFLVLQHQTTLLH